MTEIDSYLWILKYQPSKLEEIAGRKDFIERIKYISSRGDMGHLMFSGAHGYGKMNAAILASKEILGDSFEANCKIVYASDPLSKTERDDVSSASYVSTSKLGSTAGKSFTWPAFIFSRIKPFVELKPIGEKPFKILVIKDFHVLEGDQQGLRRMMEKYSSTCRMILITDQISAVIDPIISRCSVLFFNKIDEQSFSKVIEKIAEEEHLELKGNVARMLYLATEGRLEDAIGALQKASLSDKVIDADCVYGALSSDYNLQLSTLMRSILQGKLDIAKDQIKKLNEFGYTMKEIMASFCLEIYRLPIAESLKAGLINVIADADFNSINANDENIQSTPHVQQKNR
jgi:DNA polymerase III delta prime subunit